MWQAGGRSTFDDELYSCNINYKITYYTRIMTAVENCSNSFRTKITTIIHKDSIYQHPTATHIKQRALVSKCIQMSTELVLLIRKSTFRQVYSNLHNTL